MPAGLLVDRWGPRLVLAGGSVLLAAGQLLLAFAPSMLAVDPPDHTRYRRLVIPVALGGLILIVLIAALSK